jgi:hypothetical protein
MIKAANKHVEIGVVFGHALDRETRPLMAALPVAIEILVAMTCPHHEHLLALLLSLRGTDF